MHGKALENLMPMAPAATYIGFFDHMADPLKLAGFIVMILQGIYITCKIYGEYRKAKRNEQDSED